MVDGGPTPGGATQDSNKRELEQLRFAVVLNGGVSLAVWMGGAVHELHRLTRGAGTVYPTLLEWAMSAARVDVISGTSAGGINGAALALAQSNAQDPDGRSLAVLRDVWLESGSIQNLLHPPFRRAPASLLRGDGYFLPQMNRALRTVAAPYTSSDPGARPVDLTITTTLLRGVPGVVVDSAGQQVGQIRHDGLFRFRRGPTHPDSTPADPAGDDFANNDVREESGGLIDALALAARSTASFPVAFEPSYVPASADTAGTTPDALHPDMERFLSGAWDQSQGDRKRARYAVDGGVLANTPTRPAMEAIDAMPPDGGLVRRVLLLVQPHAPAVKPDSDDDATTPPTLVGVGSSLFSALTSEGSRNFVDLVERHNDAAAERREMRADVVARYGDAPLADRDFLLRADAARGYGLYRRARLRRAARDLAQIWRTRPEPGGEGAHPQARVQPAALVPTIESILSGDTPGTGRAPDRSAPQTLLPKDRLPAPDEMGFAGALGIADAAVDYLKRALWHLTKEADPTSGDVGENARDVHNAVKAARDRVGQARKAILDAQCEFLATTRMLLDGPPPAQNAGSGQPSDRETWTPETRTPETWTQAVLDEHAKAGAAEEHSKAGDPRKHTEAAYLRDPLQEIADAVVRARISEAIARQDAPSERRRPVHHGHADAPPPPPPQQEVADRDEQRLAGFVATLFADEGAPSPDDVLRRLGYIHILTHAVSAENTTGNSLPVDLIQLTYQVNHTFAPPLMTGEDKIAGDAMARFSGFLKRSWRINDWTWGRLDTARVLCQTVLDADRVRRYLQNREDLSGELEIASQSDAPNDNDGKRRLARRLPRLSNLADTVLALVPDDPENPDGREAMGLPDTSDLVAELAALLRPSKDLPPPTLVHLPEVFAAAVALEIARDELPVLPEAVAQDIAEGAAKRSRGAVFVEGARDDFVRAGEEKATTRERWQGLEQFAVTGFGQETPASEAGSDQMISAATTAAATTVTMLDGERSGVGALKGLTRVLRGGALLPYWTVYGLTGGNAMARALAQLSFALGGVLLVLGLLGAAPVWATTAGIGLVLVAFVYGALRSGTILHGVVLLVPALVVLAVMLSPPPEASGDDVAATGTAAADAQDGADAGADTMAGTGTTSDEAAAAIDIRRQDAGAIVLAAVAVVVGLFILGSLSPPIVGPLEWMERTSLLVWMSSRFAWMRNDRVRKVVAVLVAIVVACLVALGAYVLGRVPWQRFADALARTPNAFVVGALILVMVLAAAIGTRLAWLTYRRLQTWALIATTEGSQAWRTQPPQHPDASTASWSVVYGVVAAVVSLGLLVGSEDTTTRLVGIAVAIGGLLLLAVVPWRILIRSTRRQEHRARRVFSQPRLVTEGDGEQRERKEPIDALFFAGLNYAHLVTSTGGRVDPDDPKAALQLTDVSDELYADVMKERHANRVDEELREESGVPSRSPR